MSTNNEQATAAPQMVNLADFQALANELFNVQARLERLDQQHVEAKNNVDTLLKVVPLFAGNELTLSAVAWETAVRKCIADFARGISDHSIIMILKLRLTGPAKTVMAALNLETLDTFFATLKSTFSPVAYSDLIRKAIESGAFFKGVCPSTSGAHAYNVFEKLERTNANAIMIVHVLARCDNELFCTLQSNVDEVNTESVTG
ncbi:hypothetical protein GGF48_002349, partial [Coemansia sp. RSA 921]